MPEKPNIKFKYIFPDDYNPKYINGAYGGITPKGEIAVNFYLERQGLPISQKYEIMPEGKLGDEIDKEPSDLQTSMVRYVDTGILLNLNSAKEIIAWLNEKVEIIERMQKKTTN